MILKRFHDDKLAQTSYLIGCAATGDAVVVDPNRDIQQYIEAAALEGLRVTHVTETHIHADFVSGGRELAARTGARLYLSAEGGPDWQYGFAADADAVLLRDGDTFQVGNIRLAAVHTPGHTPEHLTFLVTDGATADRPIGALTGDFLFVGDVGRPDLLEKAAGIKGTMEAGASALYESLRRFRAEHPEWLQIWPGHGAGSACGKGIGSLPQTTLGYEVLFNWAFSHDDETAFAEAVLAGQPEPPRYFAEMKRINRDGPALLGGFTRPPRVSAARLKDLLASGAMVVDTRSADDFAAGHVRGTINIPLVRSFTTWAGWLVPFDEDFYLIADPDVIDEAVRDLAMIGLDRVAGFIDPAELESTTGPGEALPALDRMDADRLATRLGAGEVSVLDIRGAAEWEAGHIPGTPNIPLGYLTDRLDELPKHRPLVVHCESGERSAIAASLLEAHGVEGVINLHGGFREWRDVGLPVESGKSVAGAAAITN